jgi:hypothetical protein
VKEGGTLWGAPAPEGGVPPAANRLQCMLPVFQSCSCSCLRLVWSAGSHSRTLSTACSAARSASLAGSEARKQPTDCCSLTKPDSTHPDMFKIVLSAMIELQAAFAGHQGTDPSRNRTPAASCRPETHCLISCHHNELQCTRNSPPRSSNAPGFYCRRVSKPRPVFASNVARGSCSASPYRLVVLLPLVARLPNNQFNHLLANSCSNSSQSTHQDLHLSGGQWNCSLSGRIGACRPGLVQIDVVAVGGCLSPVHPGPSKCSQWLSIHQQCTLVQRSKHNTQRGSAIATTWRIQSQQCQGGQL